MKLKAAIVWSGFLGLLIWRLDPSQHLPARARAQEPCADVDVQMLMLPERIPSCIKINLRWETHEVIRIVLF